MSYSQPLDRDHADRVEAIQRDLYALKLVTSIHARTVSEQVDRIQERLSLLTAPIDHDAADTIENDV